MPTVRLRTVPVARVYQAGASRRWLIVRAAEQNVCQYCLPPHSSTCQEQVVSDEFRAALFVATTSMALQRGRSPYSSLSLSV